MTARDDGGANGGPAFPVNTGNPDGEYQVGYTTAQFPGMSLRDWFAGQVIPGLSADPGYADADPKDFAGRAYEIADAMLAARGTP